MADVESIIIWNSDTTRKETERKNWNNWNSNGEVLDVDIRCINPFLDNKGLTVTRENVGNTNVMSVPVGTHVPFSTSVEKTTQAPCTPTTPTGHSVPIGQPCGSVDGKEKKEKTLQISVNPYIDDIPTRFPRYRHPSHKHRLFMLLGVPNQFCSNRNCGRGIRSSDTIFCCLCCDYYLCQMCFQLNSCSCTYQELDGDDEIEDFTISPLGQYLKVHNGDD